MNYELKPTQMRTDRHEFDVSLEELRDHLGKIDGAESARTPRSNVATMSAPGSCRRTASNADASSVASLTSRFSVPLRDQLVGHGGAVLYQFIEAIQGVLNALGARLDMKSAIFKLKDHFLPRTKAHLFAERGRYENSATIGQSDSFSLV